MKGAVAITDTAGTTFSRPRLISDEVNFSTPCHSARCQPLRVVLGINGQATGCDVAIVQWSKQATLHYAGRAHVPERVAPSAMTPAARERRRQESPWVWLSRRGALALAFALVWNAGSGTHGVVRFHKSAHELEITHHVDGHSWCCIQDSPRRFIPKRLSMDTTSCSCTAMR